MRKLITFIVTIAIIASMATTVFAATPTISVPKVPQISDIKFDVKIELSDDFWSNWFDKNQIDWSSIVGSKCVTEELSRWKK